MHAHRNFPRNFLACFAGVLLAGTAGQAGAAQTFVLTSPDDSLIGRISTAFPEGEDTLLDVARRNGLGYAEIKLVNPGLDTWLPEADAEIILPTEFILPPGPRSGIVLNIPEMRLYYYHRRKGSQDTEVMTFPIGIGREGWTTPYMNTKVTQKQEKPSWYPPESVRIEHAARGDILPKRVGPGPDNPLGAYAMRLGVPSYLIHGTNKPWGVGMRVSHGCIRLYPEDIETLYGLVSIGTPVRVINQPYKLGEHGDSLYLEAHPFLGEDAEKFEQNMTSVVMAIVKITGDRSYQVDWDLAKQVVEQARGIPIEIGRLGPAAASAIAEAEAAPNSSAVLGEASRLELRLDGKLSGN